MAAARFYRPQWYFWLASRHFARLKCCPPAIYASDDQGRTAGAGDLKFLHSCSQLGQELPKFVSEFTATYHELRKRGTPATARAQNEAPATRRVSRLVVVLVADGRRLRG